MIENGDAICPVCNNKTLMLGERIDWCQITPDVCDACGYAQPKDIEEFKQMDQLAKCWELQIWPYPTN